MPVFLQDKDSLLAHPFVDIYGNIAYFKRKDETLYAQVSIADITETSIDSITYRSDGGATISEYELVGNIIYFKVSGTDGTVTATITMDAATGTPFDDEARVYEVKFRFVGPTNDDK